MNLFCKFAVEYFFLTVQKEQSICVLSFKEFSVALKQEYQVFSQIAFRGISFGLLNASRYGCCKKFHFMFTQDLQRSLHEEEPSLTIGVKIFSCRGLFPKTAVRKRRICFCRLSRRSSSV